MAASAGVSVVIASGKAKDGVLQVTAGVTLSANLVFWQTICLSFHLFMHLASVHVYLFVLSAVCPCLCMSVHVCVVSPLSRLNLVTAALVVWLCQSMRCVQGCMHIASYIRLPM